MDSTLAQLTSQESVVLECFDAITGRTRQCAGCAIMHLENAERTAAIDPEMAAFRAITAEEEAATAVFFAVKQRGYPNASKLRHRDHTHKNALFPCLAAVHNFFVQVKPAAPVARVRVRKVDGVSQMYVEIRTPSGRWAEPDPPLGFSITGTDDGRRVRFSREMEALARGNIRKYLVRTANLRNELLYASDEGMPGVEGDIGGFINERRQRVFVLLRAVALIFPYREHALFVQQVLDAFLLMVGSIKEEDLIW